MPALSSSPAPARRPMAHVTENTRQKPAIPARGTASLQTRMVLDALDEAYAVGSRKGIIRRAALQTEYPASEVADQAGLIAVAATRAYFSLRLFLQSADEQAQQLMSEILSEVA